MQNTFVMKMVTCFAVICCGLLLFATCKKKNNRPAEQKMLVAGKWQLTASTATTNIMGIDSTIDLLADCEKDNIMTFADNGAAALDEGANICTGKNQITTAPWVLLNNNTRLAIPDSNPDTFDLAITSTQLKLTETKPNTSGSPVTYISTFKNIR